MILREYVWIFEIFHWKKFKYENEMILSEKVSSGFCPHVSSTHSTRENTGLEGCPSCVDQRKAGGKIIGAWLTAQALAMTSGFREFVDYLIIFIIKKMSN